MPDLFRGLRDLYADLEGDGLLPDTAFEVATAAGIIDIAADGSISDLTRLNGKDRIREAMPALPSRSSNIAASFLTGNGDYWIGPGPRHAAQRALHEAVLRGVGHPASAAALAFVRRNDHAPLPSITGFWVLRHAGVLVHRVPDIRQAWRRHYRPPTDANPRVTGWPGYPYLRMGLSTNATATISYGAAPAVALAEDPGRAATALNWLMARATTVRNGDTAVVAWLGGQPGDDPTPTVLPSWHHDATHRHHRAGSALHIAILDARPPSRMGVRAYWVGDAACAFARLAAADTAMRRSAPHLLDAARPVIWHGIFRRRRWGNMVMTLLQAILRGDAVPYGIMCEVVMVLRQPSRLSRSDEASAAAVLQHWAETNGHLDPATQAERTLHA